MVQSSITAQSILTSERVEFYREHGYLRVPEVFDSEQLEEMSEELNRLMTEWARNTPGWTGDWRKKYMDEDTEKKARLVAMHDLQLYSAAWMRAIVAPRLVGTLVDLLGPDVEFHHSTMHVKPPQQGHPFPMHQDYPFYEHIDQRYCDVLVHLDDTGPANGEIRFLDGSHKKGPLEHIRKTANGDPCSPHLPTDEYRLEDTVAVPAEAGDIVVFNICTIHGSYLNTTDKDRRLIRVGYRHPDNREIRGQSAGRPGLLVSGKRLRRPGDELFHNFNEPPLYQPEKND